MKRFDVISWLFIAVLMLFMIALLYSSTPWAAMFIVPALMTTSSGMGWQAAKRSLEKSEDAPQEPKFRDLSYRDTLSGGGKMVYDRLTQEDKDREPLDPVRKVKFEPCCQTHVENYICTLKRGQKKSTS